MSVGLRDFAQSPHRTLKEAERTHSVVVLTRWGQPALAVVPLRDGETEEEAVARLGSKI